MGFFESTFLIIATLFFIGSIDDLFIDVVHFFLQLKPEHFDATIWTRWRALPEKNLAIMIPAWNESSVLEPMVKTNLARVKYRNYKWFIGVYPNDEETLAIAKSLELKHPEKVVVVITDRPGPTSKAHCLNCIMRVIEGMVEIANKEGSGWIPHYIAIHDAEDVIHPEAFTVINAQMETLDFIQVPIFSLPVPANEWVSGTYLDEFAEIHLKEIPVRKALGMPIPSAGVGTFFSRTLLEKMGKQYGYWFDEGNLTEDYEISQRIARAGGKQDFLLICDQKGEIIATREYFPHEVQRSIRQKTRWTMGISLQTTAKWGFFGSQHFYQSWKNLITFYSLLRDRKTLWANPTVLSAWSIVAIALLTSAFIPHFSPIHQNHYSIFRVVFVVNFLFLVFRLFQRARFCGYIYGYKHGALAVPRIILSTYINGFACLRAFKEYFIATQNKQTRQIKWDKTDHRFPEELLNAENN